VTVTDSRPARRRPPLGIGSSLTAAYYGLGFAGLMLAEAGLVLVLLGWVLLGARTVASVPVGPGDGQKRELFLLLFLGIGVAIARFLVPPVLLALRRLAGLTRRLAGEWCGVPIAESYQPPPADPAQLSYTARLRWLLTDAATWRDLRWVMVNALVGWILAAASAALIVVGGVAFLVPVVSRAIPPPAFPGNTKPVLAVIGCAMVVTGVAAAPWLLRGYGLLAARILAPSGQAELALRVRHLSQTRSEALDTGAAEIRRIERDLHDGAQARLVAMGMTLDAAGQIIDTNPDAARALLLPRRRPGRRTPTSASPRWPRRSHRWLWTTGREHRPAAASSCWGVPRCGCRSPYRRRRHVWRRPGWPRPCCRSRRRSPWPCWRSGCPAADRCTGWGRRRTSTRRI